MPAEQTPAQMRRRLQKYLRRQNRLLIPGLLCALGVAAVQVGIGWLFKPFFDGMYDPKVARAMPLPYVCVGIVVLYGIQGVFKYGVTNFLGHAALQLGVAIRTDVYNHLQSQDLAYFHRRKTGALLSTLTNDIVKLQHAAMLVKDVVAAPLTALVLLIRVFTINAQFTVFALAATPLMAWAISRLTRRLRQISRESQERQADVAAVMGETLSHPRIVQAFVAEEREMARFARANETVVSVQMRAIRRNARVGPITDLIGSVAIAAVLFVAGSFVTQGQMTAGDLGQILFLLNGVAQSISPLGSIKSVWEEMMGAADRVFSEVLDVVPEIQDAPGAKSLPPIAGRIEFDGVSFAYDDRKKALESITWTIEPGQIVALVGATGAGKSTLADLVPRFFDPTSGVVRVDGYDLRLVTRVSLRRQIGIVPQENVLFTGTIRDNIAYGRPDATEDEVIAAACAANADGFIREKPEGYQTRVGERGATLSGGQRQRIAIARALLADPRILILDEATSALDAATEALVQEALETLMRGRTTLIIAHRLSTIARVDCIVVLEQGRIVETGTHDDLLLKRGVYAGLYEAQKRSGRADAPEEPS